MGIVKIVVADVVYVGPLAKELGPAAGAESKRHAEQLAELKGSVAAEWLATQYPEAELYADVAIYDGFGTDKPIEVFAYDENDRLDEPLSQQLQQQVAERVQAALQAHCWRDEAAG